VSLREGGREGGRESEVSMSTREGGEGRERGKNDDDDDRKGRRGGREEGEGRTVIWLRSRVDGRSPPEEMAMPSVAYNLYQELNKKDMGG